MKNNKKYSFENGWGQVQLKNRTEIRAKIENVCNIKESNRTSFYTRMYGDVIPRADEMEAITQIFAEYGIKDVWGTVENND